MTSLRAIRKKLRRRWKHQAGPVPWLLYQPMRLMLFVLRIFPTPWLYGIGAAGGRLAWMFSRRRRAGRFQIAQAFPQMPSDERDRILKRSCSTLGRSAAEVLFYTDRLRGDMEGRFEYEGDSEELLRSAAGKGAVLVQAHLGSFEIGGASMGFLGLNPAFPMRLPNNYYLGQRLKKSRQGWGVTLLPRRGAVRPMMRHLRNGDSVVLATDQNAHQSPVFVPWFGYPAATERAAAALALKTGAQLLVFWCLRNKAIGSWTIGCRRLLDGGTRHAATVQEVYDLNVRIHTCLEEVIRRAPEQYLWIHDRYRTRPEGENPTP